MADKKDSQRQLTDKEAGLLKRVDKMMSPSQPDYPQLQTGEDLPTISKGDSRDTPIDIFHGAKTAPEIPKKLQKNVETEPPLPASKATTKGDTTSNSTTGEPIIPSEAIPASNSFAETSLSETEPEIAPPEVFNDALTDKAVGEIVADEADKVLAAEDAAAKPKPSTNKPSWKTKLSRLVRSKRLWVLAIVVLIVLFALPTTRYKIVGLVIKKDVTIQVNDSQIAAPISNVSVQIGPSHFKTDANGRVRAKVSLGTTKLTIEKQYFKTKSQTLFVGFRAAPTKKISLVATGRQVPIRAVNIISGKPVSGVEIRALDTTAKTNTKGEAVIILPTTATSFSASLIKTGFNTSKVNIQVTGQMVGANEFKLVPSGHVYFLSNRAGVIDVVKANLDGTGRQTVLPGTGHEEATSTNLLASRDWRYVALKARREGNAASLYVIDTSTDKVTAFETSDYSFTPVGWYGHSFIYDVMRDSMPVWQPGRETLKSFDADNSQPNLLDQNQAEGSSSAYAYQSFNNVYLVGGLVVYNTQWSVYTATGASYDLTGKTDSIRVVQPNGQAKKDYQTFPASNVGFIQATQYKPTGIYYGVYSSVDNKMAYYNYDNQSVHSISSIDQSDLARDYPTYLISPSGSQTLWSELRDGRSTLLVGDNTGTVRKQITTSTNFSPYGWYGDSYLLVSQNNSQLFILPASSNQPKQPLKITDYYKPTKSLDGYGYGGY